MITSYILQSSKLINIQLLLTTISAQFHYFTLFHIHGQLSLLTHSSKLIHQSLLLFLIIIKQHSIISKHQPFSNPFMFTSIIYYFHTYLSGSFSNFFHHHHQQKQGRGDNRPGRDTIPFEPSGAWPGKEGGMQKKRNWEGKVRKLKYSKRIVVGGRPLCLYLDLYLPAHFVQIGAYLVWLLMRLPSPVSEL